MCQSRLSDDAGIIIRDVYEQYTGFPLPDSPPPAPANGRMPRHNTAAAPATNADYYPQGPPAFVPARNTGNSGAAGSSTFAQNRNVPQRLHQDGTRAGPTAASNASIVCPCGGQAHSQPRELIMCQTCKKAGRPKLQHAAHMGYTIGQITSKDREKYMCDKCRVMYADPFWRDSSAAGLQDAWLLPFTFLPNHRVRSPTGMRIRRSLPGSQDNPAMPRDMTSICYRTLSTPGIPFGNGLLISSNALKQP